MRVLGIDPGLTRCGLGVVERGPHRDLHLVHVSVIRTDPQVGIDQRLLQLTQAIESTIVEQQPDAVAVEQVFAQHNLASVMGTAQAAGLALVAAARAQLPVSLHTPSEVKAAVSGSGRADKSQVTNMVTRILRLTTPPRPADAADALALAICRIWRGAGLPPSSADGAPALTPAQRAWQEAEAAARRGPARRSAR